MTLRHRPGSLVPALLLFALPAFRAPAAEAQGSLPPYPDGSDILATTPSADEGAIGAIFNPAQWGVMERAEIALWASDDDDRPKMTDDWGFALGKRLGFSIRRTDFVDELGFVRGVNDYQIGFGRGAEGRYTGVAYGWSGGDERLVHREDFVAVGTMVRPTPWISYGGVARQALGDDDRDLVMDVAARPLQTPLLTLFADYKVGRGQKWYDGNPSVGIALRPVKGIKAAFKHREEGEFQISVGLSLDNLAVQAIPSFESDGDVRRTNVLVRVNPPLQGADLDGLLHRKKRFLRTSLRGRAVYQKYKLFDDDSLPLRSIVEELDWAERDPTVAGVAVNLSGFRANPTMAWEVREKLDRVRRAGRTVIVYADRMGLTDYYLASVADHLIVDPEALLVAPGVQMSRTFLEGTLKRLGIGFDEWRFFTYKSAMETFSRSSFSEADREQRQELVNDTYDEIARAVTADRGLARAEWDRIVNEEPLLSAPRLLALGLADAVGHFEDVQEIADSLVGHGVQLRSGAWIAERRWRPEERWGATPTIALVYAIGESAMDTGIRGRATSQAMARFRRRGDVRALVLRADSPGGLALPADLLTRELSELRRAGKPALVSQGRVAASGGYWLGMNADTIFTTPFTLTGSIGIIGGWAWNQGLGEKLGLTSDHVQEGRSADLLGGLVLPLLGVQVPERNLTAGERELIEKSFLEWYDVFVGRVARARDLSEERVRTLAEGRVYLGRRASRLDLVDRVATLEETIEAARHAAGIPAGARVTIEEYPPQPLLRLPSFLGGGIARALGAVPAEDLRAEIARGRRSGDESGSAWAALPRRYETDGLTQLLRHPGEPLALTPPGLLPDEEPVLH